MAILSYLWDWIVPFVIVLSILVFVHEMGHYWMARRAGVRVEIFSIGFGPELFGWTDRAGTRWKVSVVPLGGYVKMFGESDFADDTDRPAMTAAEQAVSFHHKRLGQRAAIVAAGPIANFVFAILVLIGLFAGVGLPTPRAGVGSVQPESAAAEAGFQKGDLILRVDGEPVTWFEDLRRIVSQRPGVDTRFDVLRDGQEIALNATPRSSLASKEAAETPPIGVLGITPDPAQVDYQRLGPLTAVGAAVERTYALSAQILTTLGQILTGSRTANELGGPLRIAQISGQMAQDGVVNLVFFMAALSINLGLINLFPVPMLDGGHLAFYLIEALRGKPIDRKVQEYGFRFGLLLVLLLMIFATWNDLINLKIVDFFRQMMS